jgi:hypothetical protein
MAHRGSGDGIGVLLEHDLNRAANGIACIGHRDVSCLQLEPTQALGMMPIRDRHFLGPTTEQVITPVQPHIIARASRNTQSGGIDQQDAIGSLPA